MWSVAFKMQKKDEKAEDPNSASSEFCKSRKEPNKYFFLESLDRSLQQQRKKKATQTTAVTYSAKQQKSREMGLGDSAHPS